jgi:hypothetical protein
MLTSDGCYEQPGDPGPKGNGAWISLLKTDWDARQVHWLPLCLSGSS